MKLSVVIVSYNVRYYLEQCIVSLQDALEGIDAEIFVVDNHSKDGTVAYITERYKQVNVIESPHNLGFSKANNLAIRESHSDYVLLLNPDTVVGEHTLHDALAFMDTHPDAGALGVRMMDTSGRWAKESRRGVPTPMVAFYKMVGLCNRFPKSHRFGHYYMSDLPWDEPAEIEVVSGAFCLLRKAAIDKAGYLDEDFFMYGEDIDLSYRLLKAGYKNYYFPTTILHYKGESTQKSSFRYVHVFYEAMLIFFKKHYSGMSLLLSFPIKLAIYGKAMLALARMQVEKAHKSLGFVERQGEEPLYLFVGTEKHNEMGKEFIAKRGLCAKFVACDREQLSERFDAILREAVGGGSKSETYVVFDAMEYPYELIFSVISQHPDARRKVAFYHADLSLLITENDVFESLNISMKA